MNNRTPSTTHIGFGLDGDFAPQKEIAKPFVEISVTLDRVQTPTRAVLWRTDGTGLQIWSEMHDVAERFEVGVLKFKLVKRAEVIQADGYWETEATFSLPRFSGENSLKKLVIEESGFICESGLAITPSVGEECIFVADAFPCHIAIIGLEGLESSSKTEYDLSRYEQTSW